MRKTSALATGLLLLSCGTSCATAPIRWTERCKPGQPCWPTADEWRELQSKLTGKLEQPQSPMAPCEADPASPACATALANAKNPFALQDHVGGTESAGWLGAWTASQSAYAVVAENSRDIAAAVNFARDHNLRLVIKGTGHDYLGRSSAPDSLLVWTHKMRAVTVVDAFMPEGCPATQVGTPAVTVEAGTRWLEAYQEVTQKHGRFVLGGGCTSVGAAGGFTQGGGFGTWSKKFGTAASNVLQMDIVTADGQLRVANRCQNQDLFWALRGGGGGTFGVVTRVTFMTHPVPERVGVVDGIIQAKTDAAYRELIEQFLRFYRERLSNEHWGETVSFRPDNTIHLSLVFEGLTAQEASETWAPLVKWVQGRNDLSIHLFPVDFPGARMWDTEYFQRVAPDAIQRDTRPDARPSTYWWSGDKEQVYTYWYAYQSRWIPLDLFEGDRVTKLADAFFAASRLWDFSLHINKGQAGAAADAVARGKETSVNPALYRAAALVIIGASGDPHPGLGGNHPDVAEGDRKRAAVNAAMKPIRAVTPDAGSYVNETDYFEPDWQRSFWGDNYRRLLDIKRKYDPGNLFQCHHCVGGEGMPESNRVAAH